MSGFGKFCDDLERMDRKDLDMYMYTNAVRAIEGLKKISGGSERDAIGLLCGSAMAAASVDGELHYNEYRHINGLLRAAVHSSEDSSFEEIKELIEETVDLDSCDSDRVRGIYLELADADREAAMSFIRFLSAMMAIDGDASWKERGWLEEVFERDGLGYIPTTP